MILGKNRSTVFYLNNRQTVRHRALCIYIKTPQGLENFARFYIGNKGELVCQLFDKLKGNREKIDECILQMNLMKTKNGLPVNIKVIGCTSGWWPRVASDKLGYPIRGLAHSTFYRNACLAGATASVMVGFWK